MTATDNANMISAILLTGLAIPALFMASFTITNALMSGFGSTELLYECWSLLGFVAGIIAISFCIMIIGAFIDSE